MTTIMWIAIGTTIGLVSPWIILRRRRMIADSPRGSAVPGPRHGAKILPKADPYKGVTIHPCLEACVAASEQQGHRYLAADAPELPLSGCDAGKCGCRYRYHDDRRVNEDRRFEFGQINRIDPRSGSAERRFAKSNDRRGDTPQTEPSAYFNNY